MTQNWLLSNIFFVKHNIYSIYFLIQKLKINPETNCSVLTPPGKIPGAKGNANYNIHVTVFVQNVLK